MKTEIDDRELTDLKNRGVIEG